ncbi:MAG: alpha-glucosidase/alpha-galactosidase [Phycisphaeraceae bacterium]
MAKKTVSQAVGHAAHSKAADSQKGLDGKVNRPINITFLGAGSGFCPRLCCDILLMPGAERGEIRLVDVDAKRLGMMHKVITRVIQETGRADGWTVRSSAKRREVLPGTDYAICCVEVSGTACVEFDNDIPLKYGVDQCIGDTIGPGGLFKSLRTVPVFLDILRDMRELCPKAIMLNYTNPMNIMCLSAGRAVPEIPVVGLCHSVQGTSHLLAGYAGVPYEEMRWECAGINHLAWFTKLEHKGKDLYSTVLHKKFEKELAEAAKEFKAGGTSHDARDNGAPKPWKINDIVRKDMCLHFGAFITESSGHLSEYLPYYRKNDDGRQLLRACYDGGSRFYATNWPGWRKNADAQRARLVRGEEAVKLERSWEYGSWIIEAREKNVPFRIYGNVMNHASQPGKTNKGEAGKLISNLDGDGCVEVACMIDGNGINPTRYGALPPQMAHICAGNMAMFDLAANACINKCKEAAIHALMLDPMTAALLTPRQIKAMTLEMFKAEKKYLPGF